MKKAIFLLMIIGIGLSMIVHPVNESMAAQKVILKAVSCWPVDNIANDMYKEYIKLVNERAKGELEIKFIGGPEVISVYDQMKGLDTEVIDMFHGTPGYYTGIVPEGTIPELVTYKSELKAYRSSGMLDILSKAYLEKAHAVFLGTVIIGYPTYLMTKNPASKLADIKGLKFRSIGGLTDVVAGELGLALVRIPSPEVYEALNRGIADGMLRNPMTLIAFKEYEVIKYIFTPPVTNQAGVVWVGEKQWNRIPKHLQKIMMDTMIETEPKANQYYLDVDRRCLKEATEKHGLKIVELSDADRLKLSEVRTGVGVRNWIDKNAPQYGRLVYEKVLPYIK